MRFIKMQGAGNDYVYVDGFVEELPEPPETLAPKIADRHFGVGGDGLILILPSTVAAARMRMFNADGSESEMCGNGLRCVAKHVYDTRIATVTRFDLETGAGIKTVDCELLDRKVSRVTVDMGGPILSPSEIPTTLRAASNIESEPVIDRLLEVAGRTFAVTAVSMGNPHCVTFVEQLDDATVLSFGPKIETHRAFPRRVNAEFAQVVSRERIRLRVWERGAGETLACGTGTCATVVAAVLSGRSARRVTVELLGGELVIEWRDDHHVLMTGPATTVFTGVW